MAYAAKNKQNYSLTFETLCKFFCHDIIGPFSEGIKEKSHFSCSKYTYTLLSALFLGDCYPKAISS